MNKSDYERLKHEIERTLIEARKNIRKATIRLFNKTYK
jgi:hypothetical protein